MYHFSFVDGREKYFSQGFIVFGAKKSIFHWTFRGFSEIKRKFHPAEISANNVGITIYFC